MCVVIGPAKLWGTRIYAGEFEDEGKTYHSLVYQNIVENQMSGPNCMILHIPTAERLSQDNMFDVRGDQAEAFLTDVIQASRPRMRGLGKGVVMAAGSAGAYVEVFNHGSYTIVMSNDAIEMRNAMQEVPEKRRPKIPFSLLKFYMQHFKGWSFVICCFHKKKRQDPEPVGLWYEPMYPDKLFAPGVDAHDGDQPDLHTPVETDHQVVFGTTKSERQLMLNASYAEMDKLIPRRAVYAPFYGRYKNADFVLSAELLRNGLASDEHVQRTFLNE